MQFRTIGKFVLPLLIATAGPVFADGRQAIVIANQSYQLLPDVSHASSILALSQDLRRADFEVAAFSNLDTRGMRRAVSDIRDAIDDGDEILVILAGQLRQNDLGTWLLATDASTPSTLLPGNDALSVDALAALLGAEQASAVLLIASQDIGVDAPQGVAVFSGSSSDLMRLVRDHLLVEGRSLSDVAASAGRSVTASGYLPKTRAFLGGTETAATLPDGITEADIEALFFAKAQQANTAEAYRDFIGRYPTGDAADQARRLLTDLTRSPTDIARDGESALGLTRAQRQNIQSDLTLLGFDTNGVDGIFGRGTRAAIRRWQDDSGLSQTGYLDAAQIALMERQVTDARQALERQDAAYWRETGRLGTVTGYRAYLDRYPNGIFADLARQELADLTAAAEARAWADAINADTLEAYQDFLQDYPDGIYAGQAATRITELTPSGPTQAQIDEARAQEERAVANPIFRLLAEQRLAALGYNPGPIDGLFNEATRAAILAYQEANDLTPTSYLDIASINKLLNN